MTFQGFGEIDALFLGVRKHRPPSPLGASLRSLDAKKNKLPSRIHELCAKSYHVKSNLFTRRLYLRPLAGPCAARPNLW